ncbi:MAG: hypothetical protein HY914_05085 [Desulfomonile tiedjei]|nr:hypothetical protein [Desulfomonile tiedjei]
MRWVTLPRPDEVTLRQAKSRVGQLEQLLEQMPFWSETDLFDIQKFIEDLKIVNKRGETVSLLMNRSQETVFHRLMECRERNVPARFICCKSRQLGISTLIEAFIFALVSRYPNRFALVAAHSVESAQTIFSMTKRFYRFLPRGLAAPLARDNVRCIEYDAPHSSRIQIDSASNSNLGRGGTFHYVHASEVAFWQNPEGPVLAINQAVPQHADTLVFWESTANGVQNLFHQAWVAAERGESDMQPLFLSWKGFPEYSLPVAQRERLELTPEEQGYVRTYKLAPEEIKWARHTRINQCHNSWEKFHQEYPISPEVAFIFTGMPWFDQGVLRELLGSVACKPFKRGHLDFSEDNPPEPVFVNDPGGPLEIWKEPGPSLSYSLGMDVGEGVGGDYTVIQVICNQTREVAARYRSNRVRPEAAGVDAYLLGTYYRHGLLGIERNGPGLATLSVCERGVSDYPRMTGYPNLYYHTFTDRKIPEETRRLGWITNRTTKEAMLSRLAETVESRGLSIFSRTTLLEMQGFVWDSERKTFRQNYRSPDAKLAHDDEIIALAIANEMRTYNWENRFMRPSLPSGGEF